MKAVIPAAGIGKRLRPLTYSLPKVLLNVAGKPMVSYVIDDLLELKQIDKIVLVIGYLGEKVKEFVDTAYKPVRDKILLIEQKETLGLGHAVYQTKDFLTDEPLLIVLGDTVFEFDFRNFISSEYSAIGVKKVSDPTKYGIVEAENGFISRMIEKPSADQTRSREAIGGVYLIKNARNLINSLASIINKDIRTKHEFQLTDALQDMLANGEKFVTYEIRNWFDCGNPRALLFTNEYLLGIKGNAIDASKYPNTIIKPPSYIGSECSIQNSVVGPFTTIVGRSVIRNARIENSILHEGSMINGAELDGCIIGPGVEVEGKHKDLYTADSH